MANTTRLVNPTTLTTTATTVYTVPSRGALETARGITNVGNFSAVNTGTADGVLIVTLVPVSGASGPLIQTTVPAGQTTVVTLDQALNEGDALQASMTNVSGAAITLTVSGTPVE